MKFLDISKVFFVLRCNCCKPLLFLVSLHQVMEKMMSNLWVAKLMPHAEIHQKFCDMRKLSSIPTWCLPGSFHGKQKNTKKQQQQQFFDCQRSGWQATEYHAPLWLEPGQFPVDVAPWWSGGVFKGRGCSWATLCPKDSVWEDWGTLERIRGITTSPLRILLYKCWWKVWWHEYPLLFNGIGKGVEELSPLKWIEQLFDGWFIRHFEIPS